MQKNGLIRQLGLFDSTMMMIGIVIGSGIFLTTGIMAQALPSPVLILLVWIVAGMLTLAGALTYAELGVTMPEAGGHYVYLREAYGPLYGFLFGWQLFLVGMTGSIAALGVAFAEFFGSFVPSLGTDNFILSIPIHVFNHTFQYSLSIGQIIAVAAILLLSVFNYVGVFFGKTIQNIVTTFKIGILVVFVVLGFTIGQGSPIDLSFNPTGLSFGQLIIGFSLAFIAVSWAFDGWNNINYIAGEIKNPRYNLPFSLIVGTIVITALYILTNYIYLYALPVDEMAGVVRIAEKSATALFGNTAARLISAAVIISVFGALNGSIMVGPRVYYAMANDNLFFQKVAEVHPRFRTPSCAIVLQAVWACILTLSGTFDQLITYVMFVTIIFWIAATASVFKLRKKYPDLSRPYKTWGYPVVPIIFILASSAILLNTLIKRPIESLTGVGLTLVGIPVYLFWKRKYQEAS